jgi:hypothetical protein
MKGLREQTNRPCRIAVQRDIFEIYFNRNLTINSD